MIRRATARGGRIEVITNSLGATEYDEAGERTVHRDLPGSFVWLRFKNWLLLPLIGEDLL